MYLKSNAKLQLESSIIEFENYDFNWSFVANDDNTSDILEVRISNLEKSFVEKLKKNKIIIFSFGYDGNLSTIFQGLINKIDTFYLDGTTTETMIKAINVDVNAFKNVSKSYSKSIKSSEIITDLIKNNGYILGEFDLKNDISYKNGYTCFGKFITVLKKIITSSGSKVQINNNIINIYNQDSDTITNVQIVNFSNGLLTEPKKSQEKNKKYDYIINSVAFPNLKKNSIIKIESSSVNSYCKILKYKISDFEGTYIVKIVGV